MVGPNGAGKTTLLSMSTGLLRPDAGSVSISGYDVWSDTVMAKSLIGVLPDGLRLFDRLSGAELLEYHGLLRRLPRDMIAKRSEDLLEVLGLAEDKHTLVVDYSRGMRKKIGLATALIHDPRVLFLDEPFEAIDPLSARTIRSVLHRYCEAGATIIFSSHVMALVEGLCDRLAVMHHGTLVASGPIDELRGGRSLDDVFAELVGARADDGDRVSWLGTSSR